MTPPTDDRPLGPRGVSALRLGVWTLCFASGLAGLTYEVIWLRLLAVQLGNAAFATSAVLTAVMGGMGAGALWIGRRADRGDPLRLYGLLEVGLGLCALAVPAVASAAGDLSLPLLRLAGPGWGSFGIRFVVAATVVLVPAFLMGATVPVLARFAQLSGPGGPDAVGRGVGAVYALNTAGAALGCVLAGYWLLGAWGVRATSSTAASLDLLAGTAALGLSMWLRGRFRRSPAPAAEERGPGPTALPPRLVLGLAFVSGVCVLGLETLWSRLFLIVFGHDVHAFTAMLASVLVGLALGSSLYRAASPRWRASPLLVPILFAALGTLALLSVALVGGRYLSGGLDVLGLGPSLSITRSHERGLVLQAIFAALCILPPAAAAGAIFPALCARLAVPARSGTLVSGAGVRAGRVLAANTAGAIAGPLLTPLALVPVLGLAGSLVALGGLATAASLAALWTGKSRTRGRSAASAGVLVAAVLALALLPAALPERLLLRKIGPEHLGVLFYEEGRSATVAVVENRINGERQLFVNGINEVTTRLVHDQSFELLGHLGLLVHPEPKRVAVICLGAGLAAGAVTQHDVEELVVVDLEPSVVAAARRFNRLNHGLLADPRLALIIDDGRAHLRAAEEPYDVVVLDSTHPRAVDSWLLYTREFYGIARQRLAEDGYLVQWLPLHGLSVDEFRILVGTFVDSFPGATLWVNVGFEPYGQSAYALLLGPRGTGVVDPEVIAHRLAAPRVRSALTPWGLGTPAEVLECLHAGPETLARWTRGLPINTDDHPITQFVTVYSESPPMTAARLLEVHERAVPLLAPRPGQALAVDLDRRYRSQALLLAGLLERAAAVCGPSCEKPPMFVAAWGEGLDYYRRLGALYDDDPERLLEVAAGLARHGEQGEAVATLERAVAIDGEDPSLWLHLGLVRAAAGDDARAIEAFEAALERDPEHALALVGLGRALLREGRPDEAMLALEQAVALEPGLAEAHGALGFAAMHRPREGARAEAALRRALALDPRSLAARVALGRLLLREGRVEEAARSLRSGRAMHPYDPDLLFTLAVALTRDEQRGEAHEVLDRLLEIDPSDAEATDLLTTL